MSGPELVSSDSDTFSTGSEKVEDNTPIVMERPFYLPRSATRWTEQERQSRIFHQFWKKRYGKRSVDEVPVRTPSVTPNNVFEGLIINEMNVDMTKAKFLRPSVSRPRTTRRVTRGNWNYPPIMR